MTYEIYIGTILSSEYYTTRQIAEMLGVSSDRVAELVRNGVIKASKNELRHWVIHRNEIPKLKKYIGSIQEKKTSKPTVITICPDAKEIEPNLYQCPKTDWLRVRLGAQICISCKYAQIQEKLAS